MLDSKTTCPSSCPSCHSLIEALANERNISKTLAVTLSKVAARLEREAKRSDATISLRACGRAVLAEEMLAMIRGLTRPTPTQPEEGA